MACTSRFMMPLAVGELSSESGGVHSQVHFDALGFRAREYFTLD